VADNADKVTWLASVWTEEKGRRIASTTSDGQTSTITYLTESQYGDYKPITSPDGSKIAFFRVTNEADKETGDVTVWRSKICVMNMDGTGYKELTGDAQFNGNLHWTRDGTNRITWFRITNDTGEANTFSNVKIWRTTPDSTPGEEEMLSDPNAPEYFREFSHSNLKDGRIFLIRGSRRHLLMTPDPVGSPTYEPISYPDEPIHLHKICISHDETKISYMKQTMENLKKGDEYMGAIICYADFDASAPAITNEVEITEQDFGRIIWYTSYSPDDKRIIFADNGKIMLHDVDAGTNSQLSTDDSVEYRYPNYLGSVK
jgi:hypothetical protein|tara:strand:- start:8133 stop:9080 length:948 start_codon:yes stop_codon:yes gene_type:complete